MKWQQLFATRGETCVSCETEPAHVSVDLSPPSTPLRTAHIAHERLGYKCEDTTFISVQHRHLCSQRWRQEQVSLQAVGVTFVCHFIDTKEQSDRILESQRTKRKWMSIFHSTCSLACRWPSITCVARAASRATCGCCKQGPRRWSSLKSTEERPSTAQGSICTCDTWACAWTRLGAWFLSVAARPWQPSL